MNLTKLAPQAPSLPKLPGQPPVEQQGEAPTLGDAQQSFVHHMDSVAYNAKHAAAHQDEVHAHASALVKLMKRMPGLAKHARRM